MSVPLYRTETRSIPLGDLPTELRHALLKHADKQKLRLANSDVWLTHCANDASKTFLGRLLGRRTNNADPHPFHELVLILHETHLFVATAKGFQTKVLSMPLIDATMTHREGGLDIRGFAEAAGKPVTYFMSLGTGAAADACVAASMAAIERAKVPAA